MPGPKPEAGMQRREFLAGVGATSAWPLGIFGLQAFAESA